MNCPQTRAVIAGLLLGRWDGRNRLACLGGVSVLEHRATLLWERQASGMQGNPERKPAGRQDQGRGAVRGGLGIPLLRAASSQRGPPGGSEGLCCDLRVSVGLHQKKPERVLCCEPQNMQSWERTVSPFPTPFRRQRKNSCEMENASIWPPSWGDNPPSPKEAREKERGEV